MKKQKTIPLFVENDDGKSRINPAYTGKEKIIRRHSNKTKDATSVYALNPEIHNAEAYARALAELYERRNRYFDELVRNGGLVVHMTIRKEEMEPRVVPVTIAK